MKASADSELGMASNKWWTLYHIVYQQNEELCSRHEGILCESLVNFAGERGRRAPPVRYLSGAGDPAAGAGK